MDKVINPETNKQILVGKGVYNKLIQSGYHHDMSTNTLVKDSQAQSHPQGISNQSHKSQTSQTSQSVSSVINPLTNRSISTNGPIFKKLLSDGYYLDRSQGKLVLKITKNPPVYTNINKGYSSNLDPTDIIRDKANPDKVEEVLSIFYELQAQQEAQQEAKGSQRDQKSINKAWTPIRLKFKNVFAYGSDILNDIQFEEGINYICAQNAVGKTSIINMITFAVSDVLTTLKGNNILHFGCRQGLIELHITCDNVTYVITKDIKVQERLEKTHVSTTLKTLQSANNPQSCDLTVRGNEYETIMLIQDMFPLTFPIDLFSLDSTSCYNLFNKLFYGSNNFNTVDVNATVVDIDNNIKKNIETIRKLEALKDQHYNDSSHVENSLYEVLNQKHDSIKVEISSIKTHLQEKELAYKKLLLLETEKTQLLPTNACEANSSNSANNCSLDQAILTITELQKKLKSFDRITIIESKAYKKVSQIEELITNLESELPVQLHNNTTNTTNIARSDEKLKKWLPYLDTITADTCISEDNTNDVNNSDVIDINDILSELEKLDTCNDYGSTTETLTSSVESIDSAIISTPLITTNKNNKTNNSNKASAIKNLIQGLPFIAGTSDRLVTEKTYIELIDLIDQLDQLPTQDTQDTQDTQHLKKLEEHDDLQQKEERFNELLHKLANYIHENQETLETPETDDDTLQIVHSIKKLKTYIDIITISEEIEAYQTFVKQYPIKQELLNINHSMKLLQVEIKELEQKNKSLSQELSSIKFQIENIKQRQQQIIQNAEKLKMLIEENSLLTEKLSLYRECNRVFNMLSHELLSNKVDQFVYNVNAILDTFKYQINASLKLTAIELNIVAIFQDGKRGQVIDYPSNSEKTLINTVVCIVLNQLSNNANFLMVDDLFSTLDSIPEDLIDLIKTQFRVILLSISQNDKVQLENSHAIGISYDYDSNSSTICS